jgi:quercetin dioxygenase-like cupin family protein
MYRFPAVVAALLLTTGAYAEEKIIDTGLKGMTAKELNRNTSTANDGMDVVQILVSLEPNYQSPKHMHPGDETFFVRNGAITVTMEGGHSQSLKEGEAIFIKKGMVHQAKAGAEPTTLFITGIYEKGKPFLQVVE